MTAEKLSARIATIRRGSEFSNVPNREYAVLPITVIDANEKAVPATENDTRPMVRAVLITKDDAHPYDDNNDSMITQWRTKIAGTEWKILAKALAMEDLFEGVTSFDAVVVVAGILTLIAYTPGWTLIRQRRWRAALLMAVAVAVFGHLLYRSLSWAGHRLGPRVERLEDHGPR